MNKKKIIYSINIEDVCNVASQELGRDLSATEMATVAGKIGDYIDWQQAIENVISDCFV